MAAQGRLSTLSRGIYLKDRPAHVIAAHARGAGVQQANVVLQVRAVIIRHGRVGWRSSPKPVGIFRAHMSLHAPRISFPQTLEKCEGPAEINILRLGGNA